MSKLKHFNTEKVGIDDELIQILYEMTIVIDDYYALNQMMANAPNGNADEPNGINSKGSQMLLQRNKAVEPMAAEQDGGLQKWCEICNVRDC